MAWICVSAESVCAAAGRLSSMRTAIRAVIDIKGKLLPSTNLLKLAAASLRSVGFKSKASICD
jgi:hypothetical protein